MHLRTRQLSRAFHAFAWILVELTLQRAVCSLAAVSVGLGSSAIGTLFERTTHFTLLLHMPRMPAHASGTCTTDTKNGAPLAGQGAAAVRGAITRDA
jgi:hypothetical protein